MLNATLEVGGNVGEVSRIGIRASVIRTADGAEIIVPNGSLISSQVTNWTFSDRKRAVELSINAAGGADPQRVVELLKTTAAAHPGVAKEPSPQVYVTNFSAGAVTFQLRVRIDRYEDSAQLRSDLSLAVNSAFGPRENCDRIILARAYCEIACRHGTLAAAATPAGSNSSRPYSEAEPIERVC